MLATIGGGQVLVGVRPDGSPAGIELGVGSQEQLIQRVLAGTDPRVYVALDRPVVGGHKLLRITLPAGDGPHLAFGRAFHRPGPATVQMTRDEYERRRLLDRLRGSSGWEQRPADGCTEGDLAVSQIEAFRQLAALEAGPPFDLVRRLKLMVDGVPRNGAVLLFGTTPQDMFPQAAFYRAGLIEEWGTGTLRVIDAMNANGNPPPTFAEERGGIHVVLPLRGTAELHLEPRQREWMSKMQTGRRFKTADYAQASGVTSRTALTDLKSLAERGLVQRHGRGPASYWVIV